MNTPFQPDLVGFSDTDLLALKQATLAFLAALPSHLVVQAHNIKPPGSGSRVLAIVVARDRVSLDAAGKFIADADARASTTPELAAAMRRAES